MLFVVGIAFVFVARGYRYRENTGAERAETQ
jgi:hypothetical protein